MAMLVITRWHQVKPPREILETQSGDAGWKEKPQEKINSELS